jgi:hypothetical protein
MPEGFFPGLPPQRTAQYSQRTGKLYDVELFGDLRAHVWDGGFDLSGGADATATVGFYLDQSAGAAQFQQIYAEGGSFTNVTLTGDLIADAWDGGTDLSGGADGTATAGWFLDSSAGAAQFQQIYAEGGTLNDLTLSGNLIMDGTGLISTASSGVRIVVQGGSNNWISFYTDDNAEITPAYLVSATAGTDGTTRTLRLGALAPQINTNGKRVSLQLYSETEDGTSTASRLVIGSQSDGTGGSLTPYVYVADPLDLYLDNDLLLSGSADQYLSKSDTGDLYIRNTINNSGNLRLSTKYNNAQIGRILIDADGETLLSDRDGTAAFAVRTDGYVEVHLNRIYFGNASNDYIIHNDSTSQWQIIEDTLALATFDVNGGNPQLGLGDSSPEGVIDISDTSGGTSQVLMWQSYAGTASDASVVAEWRNSSNSTVTRFLGAGSIENATGNYNTISDVRLKVKETIEDARDYSDDLRLLRPRRYAMKAEPDKLLIGYVAQEVEAIKPGFVHTSVVKDYEMTEDGKYAKDADGKRISTEREQKSVKTSLMVPLLHSGWLAHDKRLEELEKKISRLEEKMENCKCR